jgi:hypothetical protein
VDAQMMDRFIEFLQQAEHAGPVVNRGQGAPRW